MVAEMLSQADEHIGGADDEDNGRVVGHEVGPRLRRLLDAQDLQPLMYAETRPEPQEG